MCKKTFVAVATAASVLRGDFDGRVLVEERDQVSTPRSAASCWIFGRVYASVRTPRRKEASNVPSFEPMSTTRSFARGGIARRASPPASQMLHERQRQRRDVEVVFKHLVKRYAVDELDVSARVAEPRRADRPVRREHFSG